MILWFGWYVVTLVAKSLFFAEFFLAASLPLGQIGGINLLTTYLCIARRPTRLRSLSRSLSSLHPDTNRYGFNPGSAYLYGSGQDGDILATLAATNTTLAAGSAGLSTLFINFFVERRISGKGQYKLVDTMNGVLAGLVAITAPCGTLPT